MCIHIEQKTLKYVNIMILKKKKKKKFPNNVHILIGNKIKASFL